MVTNQDVLQHITGHTGGTPLQLSWQSHFTQVQQPRTPGRSAFTSAPFQTNMGFPNRPDQNGTYRLQNVRITVSMNRAASWVVNGQQSASLLEHEQGHFNITWLIMRELCRQLLNVEWDKTVLDAIGDNNTARIQDRFRQDASRLTQAASNEVSRINVLYDSMAETNHGANAGAQARWTRFFRFMIQNPTNDPTSLLLFGGGSPTGF